MDKVSENNRNSIKEIEILAIRLDLQIHAFIYNLRKCREECISMAAAIGELNGLISV